MFTNVQLRSFGLFVAGFSAALILNSCGGGGSSIAADLTSDSFPEGMAVASPTATASSSDARVGGAIQLFRDGFIAPRLGEDLEDGDFASKVEAFEIVTGAATDSACQVGLPPFTSATNPNCYGPTLDYQNHPEGSPTSGQLPSGDLGIWTAAENDGTACTAAKINSLIQTSASYADYVMLLSASMICLIERNGETVPDADGEILDLTTELNEAIQVNNPNVTITTGTMENLTDIVDTDDTTRDAWKYTLIATDTGGPNTVTITAYMKHMPTTDGFKGRMWIDREGSPNANDHAAASVIYEKTADTLKVGMHYTVYQGVSSPTIFDANGNIDLTGQWSGNMSKAVLNVDSTTGLGFFAYGWQAGVGDSHARIFNGFTDTEGGCGFFGFGEKFDQGTGDDSDLVIDGFICNWAGPGGNHNMTSTTNFAQKQCMTLDTDTGILGIDSSRNKIAFAPTNSCNGDGNLEVRTGSDPFADATLANDLVDLSADPDFADYTAPSEPDLPDDL